jgi:hypothetical protein
LSQEEQRRASVCAQGNLALAETSQGLLSWLPDRWVLIYT